VPKPLQPFSHLRCTDHESPIHHDLVVHLYCSLLQLICHDHDEACSSLPSSSFHDLQGPFMHRMN
jgi:hypothetical protein